MISDFGDLGESSLYKIQTVGDVVILSSYEGQMFIFDTLRNELIWEGTIIRVEGAMWTCVGKVFLFRRS